MPLPGLGGPIGLDKLEQGLMLRAAEEARDKLTRGKPGRAVYVLIVAADGQHAAKAHAFSPLSNGVAMGIAEAMDDEAKRIRNAARMGATLKRLQNDVDASSGVKRRG